MPKAVSKIDPALTKELAVVSGLLAKLPKKITSDKEYAFVEEANKQANAFVKKVKAAKDKIEKPLKEAVKALKAEYEPLLVPAEAILDATKPLIAAWAFAKEQEAEKERARKQKELDDAAKAERKAEVAALRESGDKASARILASAPIVAQEAVVESKAARDDLSFRKDVEVEIVDIDLVPPLYVNKSLRLADVKAAWKLDNSIKIPGLKLRETRIVARSS